MMPGTEASADPEARVVVERPARRRRLGDAGARWPVRRRVAVAVLSTAPHDVPSAIVALGVAAFELRQRLTDPSTCAV
jgi:hypothetical protein